MVKLQKPELHIGYRLQKLKHKNSDTFYGTVCACVRLQKFNIFYEFYY